VQIDIGIMRLVVAPVDRSDLEDARRCGAAVLQVMGVLGMAGAERGTSRRNLLEACLALTTC
jgi:hypothetical protein